MAIERFTLKDPDWPEFLFHMQRYSFARSLAHGKSVLDCACGEGYGSAYVAEEASTVQGVDISEEAIGIARSKYAENGNLTFTQADMRQLPFADATFDLVICFETIEHVGAETQVSAVKELTRVLKADGILLMSTPDRDVSVQRGYNNPYHINELTVSGLRSLLRPYFRQVQIYTQELNMAAVMLPLADLGDRAACVSNMAVLDQGEIGADDRVRRMRTNSSHMYLVSVCSNESVQTPLGHAYSAYKREPAFALWNRIDALERDVRNGAGAEDSQVTHAREAELQSLRAELATNQEAWQVKQDELGAASTRFADLSQRHEALQVATDAMAKELEEKRADFLQQSTAMQSLHAELAAHQEAWQVKQDELEAASTRFAELSQRHEALQVSADAMAKELEEKRDLLVKHITALQDHAGEFDPTLDAFDLIDRLRLRDNHTKRVLDGNAQELNELKAQVGHLEHDIATLISERGAWQDRFRALQDIASTADASLDVDSFITHLRDREKDIADRLETSAQEIAELSAQVHHLEYDNLVLAQANSKARTELVDAFGPIGLVPDSAGLSPQAIASRFAERISQLETSRLESETQLGRVLNSRWMRIGRWYYRLYESPLFGPILKLARRVASKARPR